MAHRLALAVSSDGIALDGGAYRPEGAARGTVLLLHGIPSINPAEPGDTGYPGVARRFADEGFITGWVDMRAVRASAGVFSIEGWVADARAALDALMELEGTDATKVAVVGSSAGGAVATEMTRRGAPVDALVLLAAPAVWRWFAGDPREGMRRIIEEAGMELSDEARADPEPWAAEFDNVQTVDAIGEVDVPVLVAHGSADDVVPVSHANEIAERARRAETLIVEGGGHQLRKDEATIEAVLEWLTRTL